MAILKLDQYSDHAKAAWKSCMESAFRTSLACVIVGIVTLFGPAGLNRHITLPAFSYVTVVLVVTDAALGDALRGCWHAAYASLTGILPSILALWLIGPGRMSEPGILAAAVGLSAFAVVVQEKSHLISKRIALGQIVLVYVFASINGSEADPVMHPVGVLVSTAVGVAACVLALLLPYPSLATSEVKKNFKLCTKTASERLKLFVKAFSAEDKAAAHALLSQANFLAKIGTKLLRTIKSKQDGMIWERLPFKYFLKPYCKNPVEKLQHLETPLRGMEIALSSSETLIPVKILNSDLKDEISRTEEHIACQIKSMPLLSGITMPENTIDHQKLPQALQTSPLDQQDLPSFFFLFCLKLLQKKSMVSTKPKPHDDKSSKKEGFWKGLGDLVSSRRLMPALKCSLSLFLAVFLGAIYSKENAHWAGLPVAVSLAASREATFKIANIKAQGTVLGTVYGVFGCFMFQKYATIRLLSLVPWFLFCSFLRRSRMYGQAGGISAVIGAVLILGRKNFGPPSEFAIARITETFIGLSCSIFVELILQPTRASALAKIELSKNLHALKDSISGIGFSPISRKSHLKIQVSELGKFVQEAEVEPNFWFLPFPSACYGKLLESLTKMVDFLAFTTCAIESMHQESGGHLEGSFLKENLDKLNLDLNLFKQLICSSLKFCEEVNLVKSLDALDKEVERKKICVDLEMGKPGGALFTGTSEEVMEKGFIHFLDHCKEFLDGIKGENEEEKEMKSQIVLSLGALAFCMNGIIRESKEVEKSVKEIVQWENPSRLVDFQDISRKISALGALQGEEESQKM